MIRVSGFVLSAVFAATAFVAAVTPAVAQVRNIKPVTDEMLRDPSPNDWLMYSRTYDAFRAPSAAGTSERGDVWHRNHRHGWGNEHLLARRRFQLRHQRFGRQVAIDSRG